MTRARRTGTIALAIAVLGFVLVARRGHPAPVPQPIAFSHALHAGKNAIGCTYCHTTALRGPVAGIPSAQRCYGCHRMVDADKPDIQQVTAAYTDAKPIAWNRVNRLPDHVVFNHERHLANGVDCVQCHGQVATMDVIQPVTDFPMGFCVECHRAKGAPTDCLTCHK